MSNNLKALRKKRKLTQDRLSKLSGVNRVSIARYEAASRNMTLETAAKIADALNCTIDQIAGRQEA